MNAPGSAEAKRKSAQRVRVRKNGGRTLSLEIGPEATLALAALVEALGGGRGAVREAVEAALIAAEKTQGLGTSGVSV